MLSVLEKLAAKGSNLILSVDLENFDDVMLLINRFRPYILGVKLHSDIYHQGGFSSVTAGEQESWGDQIKTKFPDLLIIEDRKFCDIRNTVRLQSQEITEYADLITVHSLSGQGVIDGLRDNCLKNDCGILLIAQMSSENNLLNEDYTERTVALAEANRDIVRGFICQERLADGFLHFTPGIRIGKETDGFGQKYMTPQTAINEKGTDILIVGRGLYEDESSSSEIISSQYNTFTLWRMRQSLFENGIVSYRDKEFTLKSGVKSKVYADFRRLMGLPDMFRSMGELMCRLMFDQNVITPENMENTVIIGVPMGAIPLSTLVSQQLNLPMALLRQNRKDHGKQNLIEGVSEDTLRGSDVNVVILEDVITSGGSALETIDTLCSIGVKRENMTLVTILDRECGGLQKLEKEGQCKARSLFKLSSLTQQTQQTQQTPDQPQKIV